MLHRLRRSAGVLLALATLGGISLTAPTAASAAPPTGTDAAATSAACGTPHLDSLYINNKLVGQASIAFCEGTRRHLVVADKSANGLTFGLYVLVPDGRKIPYTDKNGAANPASQYDITYPTDDYLICDGLNLEYATCRFFDF